MNSVTFIRSKQAEWFTAIKPFLMKNNLNVGSGLGYFSKCAHDDGFAMVSLEVHLQPGTVN